MAALDAIASEVRDWYGTYVAIFTSLATGKSSDLESLAAFFALPSTSSDDKLYLVAPDQETVKASMGAQIEYLRKVSYAGSTLHGLEIRPLSTRAAVIEGVLTRLDRAGKELARLRAIYLAAKTEEGWRFASLILIEE
jgi:hypothetical protein